MATAIDNDVQEFDQQRKVAQQQVNAQKQGQQDALKRRFAAMGGLNNGAYIKANENVEQAGADTLTRANEGINAQQNSELRRRREVATGMDFTAGQNALQRAFQTQERLGSQDFSGQQAGLNRQFQTSERLGGQEFAGGQNAMARALQQEQMRQQGDQFSQTLEEQRRQAADRGDQFNRSYDLEKKAQEFNTQMAFDEANRPNTGILGSILGDYAPKPGSPLGRLFGGGSTAAMGSIAMGPVGAAMGGVIGGGLR